MEVKVYATLREVVGGKMVVFENLAGLTVGQMLEQLFDRFPALRSKLLNREGEFHSAFHILINGRDARYLDGLETMIKADDEIRIFPPVGGGSGEAQL
jgi:MoaD family protein